MARRPVLRPLVALVLLFVGAAERRSLFALVATGEVGPSAERPPGPARTFKCPEGRPGPLRLLPDSPSCNAEIAVCRDLGVIYLHSFKSAGNAYMANLDAFCSATTGKNIERIAGWDRKAWLGLNPTLRGSPCDVDVLCAHGWICYSTIRDPIERFLSAFHEVMKRQEHLIIRGRIGALPLNATLQMKLDALEKLVAIAERNPRLDAHLGPQKHFLPKHEPVELFRLEEGGEPVNDFLCDVLQCRNRVAGRPIANRSCPRVSVKRVRSRKDAEIRMPQYDIDLRDVPLDTIRRITALFREDYCRLGYATKPGAEDIITCDQAVSADWRKSSAPLLKQGT